MIQSDFSRMISLESIRFSGGEFRFVVETLHNATGELAFGPEPVHQQRPMLPQHPGNLLHGFDLRAHRPGAPFIQKLASPIGRRVCPEGLEILFQKIASHRFQVVLQKVRQFGLLLPGKILRALEQKPTGLRQYRLIAGSLQFSRFLSPHFVNHFAQMRHDVEPVQNMDGLPCFLRYHFQVGLPHVTANIGQFFRPLFSKPAEESQQGLDLPFLANPEQPPAVRINLIDQCSGTYGQSATGSHRYQSP